MALLGLPESETATWSYPRPTSDTEVRSDASSLEPPAPLPVPTEGPEFSKRQNSEITYNITQLVFDLNACGYVSGNTGWCWSKGIHNTIAN